MKPVNAIGILVLATVLAACGTTYGTHGEDLNEETAGLIERGMTQSDVKGLLGDPYRVTGMGETRELWTYRYYRVKVDGKVICRPVPQPEEGKMHPYHGAIFILFDSDGEVSMIRRG